MAFISGLELVVGSVLFLLILLGFFSFFKWFYYVKKNKPKLLDGLLYKGHRLFEPPFEFQKLDPWKFIKYLFKIHPSDDRYTLAYKFLYVLGILAILFILFYPFLSL